jgi:hypothetical protein
VSSLSHLFALKAVDVFSFHLQIFHWFMAPPLRRYFQGHSPRDNPTPLSAYDFFQNIFIPVLVELMKEFFYLSL